MRIIIIEGARCVGKSTIVKNIREKISEVTSVNATGFHLEGEEGHDKIFRYYSEWINFLKSMKSHDSVIVFDRFFFSEMVYSKLYKDYDFSDDYDYFVRSLFDIAESIDVILLAIDDEEELTHRLVRDKVEFSNVEESVCETMRQQEIYDEIISELNDSSSYINTHRINTTKKAFSEVESEVFEIIGAING